MGFWKQGVIAGLAVALLVAMGWGGIYVIAKQTNVMSLLGQPAPAPAKTAELRPVVDEKEATVGQPLTQVWEHYVKNVRYYTDAFGDVLRSRLRHRQFEDLEAYAKEIRSKKSREVGGKWLLQNFYEALEEPSEGHDSSAAQWQAHLALIDEWRKAFPKSITANVAYANAMEGYAFQGRSHEFASKVTDAQWKLFDDRTDAAEDILIEAEKLEEKCPGWFDAMGDVALAQSWDREERMDLFNEAVAFEPTYVAYYTGLAYYLLPRWHGEEGEWPRVLAEITDKQGTDEAHALYNKTFSGIVFRFYKYDEIAPDIKKFWPQIKRGYQARAKLYNVTYSDMNDIARMAYIVGDREQARSVFPTIQEHKNLSLWENDQALFDKAKAWANGN